MCSPFVLAAMTVELRHNTSKSSFETLPSGEEVRTLHGFFTTLSSLQGKSRAVVVKLW